DLNVPLEDGKVGDLTRIERVAPTIREIADKSGKVILLSHFGRPKGPNPKQSLKPVAAAVAQVVGRPVAFAEDCTGPRAEAAVAALRPGDILCLENTRFTRVKRRTIRSSSTRSRRSAIFGSTTRSRPRTARMHR